MPASVQKRTRRTSSGRAVTRHIVRWRDPDGPDRSKTERTKAAADARARRVDVRLAQGLPGLEQDETFTAAPTVAAWSETWLDLIAARIRIGKLAPRTGENYESRVRLHIVPRLGRIRLDNLTVGHVEDALTQLQADGNSGRTAADVRQTLGRMLTDAQKRDLVTRNVAHLAEPPRAETRRPSAFDAGEMAALLDRCQQHRLGPLFLLAALAGLRASELRALRWSGIDLHTGTYTVTAGLHRVTAAASRVATPGLIESHPKTDGSGATTPLSPAAVALLREHRKAQAAARLAAPAWRDDDLVFTNMLGGPLEPRNVLRSWRRLVEDAGVNYRPDPTRPGRGLHELRRTFAKRLRDAGVPIEDVQHLGRWASPAVLLRSYAATDDTRLRAAAQAAADGVMG